MNVGTAFRSSNVESSEPLTVIHVSQIMALIIKIMDAESMKILTKGLTMAIGGIAPALAIGNLVGKAMEAIGRNPEASDKVFVPMLLGAAFAEAIAIYSLVVVFVL